MHSYKNGFSHPIDDVIGYRAAPRRRFGDWEKRKRRNSYRRDSKTPRGNETSVVGRARVEEKNVEGREKLAGVQLSSCARQERRGENYERRHSLSHWGSFSRKYFSKRLSKLFTHFARRQKSLSVGLIIGKIVAVKESDGENETDSNGTKYL